jgi:hypothetical protein
MPGSSDERPPARRPGPCSSALIALTRAVPALFPVGWRAAAVVWLAQARLEHAALAALPVAVIAASFGAGIALFSRR